VKIETFKLNTADLIIRNHRGPVERLNYFVGVSLNLAFQDFKAKNQIGKRFDIESALSIVGKFLT